MKTYILGLAMAICLGMASCTESIDIAPNEKGTLTINFNNTLNGEDVVLGTTKGNNASGESFTVSTLNYFISNISLTDSKGNEVKFPDNYYLIREADPSSQSITLTDIPAGDYISMTYIIGVDSLKNVADVSSRTGVLDPASYGNDNMYWSWNMGYIFFKIEGNSEIITNDAKQFQFHIGGFGGKDAPTPNNLQTISHNLSGLPTIRIKNSPKVTIELKVDKIFEGNSLIKLVETPMIHNPSTGKLVSANYVNAFSVSSIQ